MSTNHTQNYKLCQWEASDKVLRTDFNDDNVKLDAALAAQQTAINQVNTLASNAYGPSKQAVVTGSYYGNGAESRTISLGFTPRAVLVFPCSGQISHSSSGTTIRGGLAISGVNVGSLGYTGLSTVANGFSVRQNGAGSWFYALNNSGENYVYLAFR